MYLSSIQQNNRYNVKFGSGLTPDFVRFAREVDPKKVEEYLFRTGIDSDFCGNQTIAACAYQSLSIFKNLGLSVPKGIYARKIADRGCYGLADTRGNVFFNIDNYCDLVPMDNFYNMVRKYHLAPSSHFLRDFLHEFTHCLNFENIKMKKNLAATYNDMLSIRVPAGLKSYISEKHNYITEGRNIFEILAETMEMRFSRNLDSQTLMTSVNPFAQLKFENSNLASPLDRAFKKILGNIYEGDTSQLRKNLNPFSDRRYFS